MRIELFKWACGLWLGCMLFFTAGVTPALFSSFDRQEAGRVVAVLFPSYHSANHLAFLLVLGIGLAAARTKNTPGLASALALLAAAWVAGPALNQFWLGPYLRDLKAAGDLEAFGKWHGLSMLLNLAAMILVAAAPWLVARHYVADQDPAAP